MTKNAMAQPLPGCRPLPPLGGHERKRADIRGKNRECIFFGNDHFANMGVVKVVGEAPVGYDRKASTTPSAGFAITWLPTSSPT